MDKIVKGLRLQIFMWTAVLLLSMGGTFYCDANNIYADTTVYITRTGSKYHTHKCGNGTYYASTLSEAKARGLTPCSKCYGSSYSSSNSSGGGNSSTTVTKTAVKNIKINKTSLLLVKGQSSKLKISNATSKVKWKSSKKSIAAVSSTGKITAKKKGKAVITATVGSQSKKCTVTVEAPELNATEVEMEISETKTLRLSGCKHSVKWTTSNSDVVKVKKGKLTAKEAGKATIKATVHGKKFSCKVKVKEPETENSILDTIEY